MDVLVLAGVVVGRLAGGHIFLCGGGSGGRGGGEGEGGGGSELEVCVVVCCVLHDVQYLESRDRVLASSRAGTNCVANNRYNFASKSKYHTWPKNERVHYLYNFVQFSSSV